MPRRTRSPRSPPPITAMRRRATSRCARRSPRATRRVASRPPRSRSSSPAARSGRPRSSPGISCPRWTTVLIEDPTIPGAIDVFRTLGAHMLTVPVGADGVDVDALEAAVRRNAISGVYLMPTFQSPTGAVVPPEGRRRIAELSLATGVGIVEDTTVAELALTAEPPPPPIASYSADAPVFTIGSLSKLFWAGVRVGWVRGPRETIAHLGRLKAVTDLGTSVIAQVVALGLLDRVDAMRRAAPAGDAGQARPHGGAAWPASRAGAWRRPAGGLCRVGPAAARERARVHPGCPRARRRDRAGAGDFALQPLRRPLPLAVRLRRRGQRGGPAPPGRGVEGIRPSTQIILVGVGTRSCAKRASRNGRIGRLVRPSSARSAVISPSTGPSARPCPLSPVTNTRPSGPWSMIGSPSGEMSAARSSSARSAGRRTWAARAAARRAPRRRRRGAAAAAPWRSGCGRGTGATGPAAGAASAHGRSAAARSRGCSCQREAQSRALRVAANDSRCSTRALMPALSTSRPSGRCRQPKPKARSVGSMRTSVGPVSA